MEPVNYFKRAAIMIGIAVIYTAIYYLWDRPKEEQPIRPPVTFNIGSESTNPTDISDAVHKSEVPKFPLENC